MEQGAVSGSRWRAWLPWCALVPSAALLLFAAGIRADDVGPVSEVEVPAPAEGKITELLVSKGDQIKVGQVVLRIETRVPGVARCRSPDGRSPPLRSRISCSPATIWTGNPNASSMGISMVIGYHYL